LSITLSWLEDWLLDVPDTNAVATTPATTATATTTNNDDNDDTDAATTNDIYNNIHASLDELIQSVMQASLRRVLIYPYLRSFPLGIVIWEHIASIY
jgi:SHQ1 protein